MQERKALSMHLFTAFFGLSPPITPPPPPCAREEGPNFHSWQETLTTQSIVTRDSQNHAAANELAVSGLIESQFILGTLLAKSIIGRLHNPLLPNGNYSYRIIKILFKKKGSRKNFLWAPRLWVGRRWEPILGYISKNDGIKVSGINGFNCCIQKKLAHTSNWRGILVLIQLTSNCREMKQ